MSILLHKRSLLSLILLFSVALGAQDNNVLEEVSKEFKAGNADSLGSYLASEIVLSIDENEDILTNNAAVSAIRGFFDAHIPTSFVIRHRGKSRDGSAFAIGALKTSKGDFRTYFVIRDNRIVELSIEVQ